MNFKSVIFYSILLIFCSSTKAEKIPGTDLEKKVFSLTITEKPTPSMSFKQLVREVNYLNRFIGSYPPRFSDEAERQKVYEKWLYLVSESEAYRKKNPDRAKSFYLLSELFRQGHNLDVKSSSEKAIESLSQCFLISDSFVPCHFSASYLYLSIGLAYLDKAEHSLSFLRKHYAPKLNSEVESGFAFLYIYRQDPEKAKQQIDRFIKAFPQSNRVKMFKNILKGLEGPINLKSN